MRSLRAVIYVACILCFIYLTVSIVMNVFLKEDNEPFDVNNISANDSEIQIATDISIGTSSRLLKNVSIEGHVFTLYDVQPYEGEFGIAEFTRIRKFDRYRFASASHSKETIQAKVIQAKEGVSVVLGVKVNSGLHKLIVSNGQESIEKMVSKQNFLEVIPFNYSKTATNVTIVGYDEQGKEITKKVIHN
ncbi:hypothetical protein I6N90_07830 [Paenibacillus sp. GSMTC-2017]|uniref:hypothetical protein n=1 Tax=Paenibacillus sp. GSMTC-2017 TaxID=2794350 RepID=UPI0018D8CC36|nr:hypothetical protein [Paenibacillus sp. GSMTC-2017]MBH5317710.1 hypothetical protein [Paenibacillus sp. GSMTC-2017]